MSKRKKYDFSEVFSEKDFKDIRQSVTLHPSVYSQLYKDLRFPRDDYVMQVKIIKRKKSN